MGGKRGCALKLALFLNVIGWLALVAGCVTPYWSRIVDETSGDVLQHHGLLVSYTPGGSWTFLDFNQFQDAGTDKTKLYLTLSVAFALVAIFLQFFLVEVFALAVYNASCGRRYSPDWLLVFCLLSGLTGITSLVLYQQYISGTTASTMDIKMDYSRGAVIKFIAVVFFSAFLLVCDRTGDHNYGKK